MKVSNLIRICEENNTTKSLIILFFTLTVVFTVSYKTIFNVNYTELQGFHCWLSASTIKFVNNWLEEGPLTLSFVNYESPASIEFNNNTERGPYISYPSGCTLFVYIAAKISGNSAIDISFLKHLQMICFWIETLLFGLFVYGFLGRNNVKSEFEKIIASFATASLWLLLPINVWYLANIYFADQCVTLFVMAFLIIEYEYLFSEKQSSKRLLNGIRALILFCGLLIDYYFWIMAFVAFVIEMIYLVRNQNREKIWGCILWYGLPAILAIAFYMYQLISIPNWLTVLESKFLVRTGIELTSTGDGRFNTFNTLKLRIWENFANAFGLSSLRIGGLCMLIIICLLSLDHKFNPLMKIKNYFKNTIAIRNIVILIIGFVSPILQVILLRNHSAIHEFSMIKFSWCIAIMPILFSLILCLLFDFSNNTHNSKKRMFSPFFHCFVVTFLLILVFTNVPSSSIAFRSTRSIVDNDYSLANIIRNHTSYEHVCFSFTDEIAENPPQDLSISKKRVYKINNLNDIQSMFPSLSSKAVKILVINKKMAKTRSSNQKEQEIQLQSSNKTIFNDTNYTLVQIN